MRPVTRLHRLRYSEVASVLFLAAWLAFGTKVHCAEKIHEWHIPAQGIAAAYLNEIQIRNPNGDLADLNTTLSVEGSGAIVLDLGLEDSAEKVVTLIPRPGAESKFRIRQQHETSVTVMDEGPHMDLRHWRHNLSKWTRLPQFGAYTFKTIKAEDDTFPKVLTAEIVAASEAESRRWATEGYDDEGRWAELASSCKDANSYPCAVSVSTICLHIEVRERGRWRAIQEIRLLVPMGC